MGKTKKERLKNRRSGLTISDARNVDFSKLQHTLGIMNSDKLEDRRNNFMKMSHEDRIMTFMMGERSFCVQCGKEWPLKYNENLHSEAYVCDSCGEVLGVPQGNL